MLKIKVPLSVCGTQQHLKTPKKSTKHLPPCLDQTKTFGNSQTFQLKKEIRKIPLAYKVGLKSPVTSKMK